MKKPLLLAILGAALAFGLGAASQSLLSQLVAELETRASRELVNRDLIGDLSPSGAAYFKGRSDAYAASATLDLNAPHAWAYLRGFGEAALQASTLILETRSTGEIPHGEPK